MIQGIQKKNVNFLNSITLNLYDVALGVGIYPKLQFNPLIELRSQSTNMTKTFISLAFDVTNKERYVTLYYILNKVASEPQSPTSGLIYLGDDLFPYGFFDITIYENSTAINLSTGNAGFSLPILYKGMFNLRKYEYTTESAVRFREPALYNQLIPTSPTHITNEQV